MTREGAPEAPRRPRRIGRAVGLALFAGCALGAPPDWLESCLKENLHAPSDDPAIIVLDSAQVRYLSPESAIQTRRGAIKVTADAGRSLARISQFYDPDFQQVRSARAWIISGNLKRARTYDRRDFIDAVAHYSRYVWDRQRILTFEGAPKIEVGGFLAWEFEISTPAGITGSSWNFQNPRSVAHASFEVIPSRGGRLLWHASSPRLEKPEPGSSPGALRWDLSQLRPFSLGRPTGFLLNPLAISTRCLPSGKAAVGDRSWTNQARMVGEIIDPQIETGGEVLKRAGELVSGRIARWERIRAVTEFVQRDVVYLSITLDKDYLAGCRPHRASQVLRDRYGDCKDKATLMISMLRAIGEIAHPVLLTAGDPSAVAIDWPSLEFNHMIVAMAADAQVPPGWPVVDGGPLGKLVIFDPTDSATPLGVLSPADQGGYALVVDREKGNLVRLPSSEPAFSRLDRRILARLDPEGGLQAELEENLHGLAAAEIHSRRLSLGSVAFANQLEARIHRAAPLAESFHWSDEWNASAPDYRLRLHFTTARFAHPIGDDTLLLKPQILPPGPSLNPWQTRAEGIVWLQTDAGDEETRLTLPEGYDVEEIPDAWSEERGSLSGHVSYLSKGRELTYRSEWARPAGFYSRAEYEAAADFYQKLRDAQRRPILLRRVAKA